jgi:hypothetical protein
MRRFGTFIEFDVTPEQLARAEKWFSFKELKDSITNGDGNLAGALGEVVFMDYLSNTGRVADYVGTHGHDLTFGGYTMEIKTKRSNYARRVCLRPMSLRLRQIVVVWLDVPGRLLRTIHILRSRGTRRQRPVFCLFKGVE